MSGFFISLEGTDGAGKSTQIKNIEEYFTLRDMDCIVTREPGGTNIGEQIRDVILDKGNKEMTEMTEALLYAASRAQHVEELIRPALNEGKVVICDRFIDSSFAYQGYARGIGEPVKVINEYAIDGCMPDVTFVINVPSEVTFSRLTSKSCDRLESEKIDFHKAVRDGYLELKEKYPDRIIMIDGSNSIDMIKQEIYEHLDRVLSVG